MGARSVRRCPPLLAPGSRGDMIYEQLPEPQHALKRIAKLVKLGGWLLRQDVSVNGEVKGEARAVRTSIGLLYSFLESSGRVLVLGSNFES